MTSLQSSVRSTNVAAIIPREWAIQNPKPPYRPKAPPSDREFSFDLMGVYSTLIRDLLPHYFTDPGQIPSEAATFLKANMGLYPGGANMKELMIRQFLLAIQRQLMEVTPSHALHKMPVLHNDLAIAGELIAQNHLDADLANMVDMMMAEIADVYHNQFSDVITGNYWSKTRTATDVINQLLKREMARLRQLTADSFHWLSSLIMRKTLETAPGYAKRDILAWAHANDIAVDE